MIFRFEDNRYVLSTGREFYAYSGVLGLPDPGHQIGNDDPGVLYYGYDGDVPLAAAPDPDDDPSDRGRFTQEERREIADAMIARWQSWAAAERKGG